MRWLNYADDEHSEVWVCVNLVSIYERFDRCCDILAYNPNNIGGSSIARVLDSRSKDPGFKT